ncbi:MAG: hypothetical protein J6Z11_16245, partial [Candidatus Riflebacteria bacterium]|nr:hypothetical protein [Candidatus Riflebacteria bacterium]
MSKNKITAIIIAVILAIIAGITGANININLENEKINAEIEYAEENIPVVVEDDMGEIIEINEIQGEEIKTVEEVDGGMFEDADTGVSTLEGDYEDLGWAEWYPTETPEAFKNATLGRCIYGSNRFGAQCVSIS